MSRNYDIIPSGFRGQPMALAGKNPPSLASAMPSEAPEPSLLKPIFRRWWLVLLVTCITSAGGFYYIKKARPLYTSTAKLLIQPTPVAIGEIIGNAGDRANYLATQVEIVRSSAILNLVAEKEGIRGLKTFAPTGGNPVLFLREELDVTLERKTDMLVISLASPYPEEACAIVQAVMECYDSAARAQKNDSIQQMLDSYKQRKTEQQKTVDDLQAKIFEFRSRHYDVSTSARDNTSAAQQSLNMIGAKLTEMELNLIAARQTFAPQHQTILRMEAMRNETKKLYDEAAEKVKAQTGSSGEYQLMLAHLDMETDTNRKLADLIHKTEMTLSGRNPIEIAIIEPPRIADKPSFPRKTRTMAIAAVIGALLGAGLALLRDRSDGRMRSVEEIQGIINLPILGVVPAMSGRRTAVARAMTVHLDPRSVVAEAYRTIRTAIYFGLGGGAGGESLTKTILVTSPEPGDGKTTSASNLAIAIAQTGRSVLLLDADFRKPSQHKNLEIKNAIGLSSVLAGAEPLERAIQRTGVEGLDILPCGPIPANPSEILNSREFGELVDTLASRYDHILFDSPPVNPVTDARILGAVCDATILVLRADKSTRKAGEHARNALMAVGARVLGAIVNDASKRKGYEVYGGSYYGGHDTSPDTGAIVTSRRVKTTPRAGSQDYDGPNPVGNVPPPRRRNIA